MKSFSRASCLRSCRVVLLWLFFTSLHNIEAQEEGCFENRQVSCQAPEDIENLATENIDAQQACFQLEDYLGESIWDLLYFGEDYDLSIHARLLNEIPVDSSLCNEARLAYHNCFWCAQDVSDEFCSFNTCEEPEIVDEAVDVDATCKELSDLFDRDQIPATIDLCYRAEQASYQCPIYCPSGLQEGGCFDKGELSCEAPVASSNAATNTSTINAQRVCYQLEDEYLKDDVLVLWKHNNLLNKIPSDTQLCTEAQLAYHECFWCAIDVSSDFCVFETCDKPKMLDEAVDVDATCQELSNIYHQDQWPATTDLCYRAEQAIHHCPIYCEDVTVYLGANTTPKRKALVWVSRISAFLSLLGASLIMWDVVSSRKRRVQVYHQLLFGMATFDICTAVAWAFATAPIPEVEAAAYEIYGSQGNEATCKTQAFFIQLGFTSIFYNVSLALYYVFVIVHGWREHRLKTIRPLLHAFPLLLGFGLAFGALPIYDWFEYGCHLLPPPDGPLWQSLVFVVIPLGVSILIITLSMLTIYIKVRRQAQTSRKWRFGVGTSSNLERKVFWQCLLYILAFYITWPILFSVYIASVDVSAESYGLAVTVAFVAPLQGFSNFVVYFHSNRKRFSNKGKKLRGSLSSLLWRPREGETVGNSELNSSTGRSDSIMDPAVKILSGRNVSSLTSQEATSISREEDVDERSTS